MAEFKVVCLETDHPDCRHVQDALAELPGAVLFEPHVDPLDEAAMIEAVRDADAVLYQWAHVTREVIEAMEKCKVISTFGIAVDLVDVEAATRKGILVCNNPVYNKHEVANHAFAMLCALSRQLFQFDRLTRQGKYGWPYLDVELHRPELQTVGLFSFGKISRKIAVKCRQALGMNVIFYDPYVGADTAAEYGAGKVDFDTLLRESDFICVNGPATKENFHIFDAEAFGKMKPSAYLINCARGVLVDTNALVEALKARTIAGAGIDVFEDEPLRLGHPLLDLDNVILTPHCAWHTRESMYDQGYYAALQAVQVLRGEKPPYCVNAKELGLK